MVNPANDKLCCESSDAACNPSFAQMNFWHYAMLNDKSRNALYYRALERTIVPGESVVLDIGSGSSGLLAMMAAKLGARKVEPPTLPLLFLQIHYALSAPYGGGCASCRCLQVFTVEANSVIAAMAAESIDRNGMLVAGRVQAFACASTDMAVVGEPYPHREGSGITGAAGRADGARLAEAGGACALPERATVLVSEVISTFLTSEGIEPTLLDARERLCVARRRRGRGGCAVIPAEARLVAAVRLLGASSMRRPSILSFDALVHLNFVWLICTKLTTTLRI